MGPCQILPQSHSPGLVTFELKAEDQSLSKVLCFKDKLYTAEQILVLSVKLTLLLSHPNVSLNSSVARGNGTLIHAARVGRYTPSRSGYVDIYLKVEE